MNSKPRIAFFCATYLEAEMWHIYRQIRALRQFEPVVVTQKRKNAETFSTENLHVVPRSNFRFLGRFMEKSITKFPWQISGAEARSILAITERENAKVLHVFFGNVAVHLLPLLKEIQIPVVVSFHGADVAKGRMTPGGLKALQDVFEQAAVVGCRSEALKQNLKELGCAEHKLRIFRTMVPQEHYTPRQRPEQGAWRILQACRLIEKKGVDLTLRAFAEFAKDAPHAELTVAGNGPEEENLQRLASELGIAGKVRWPGFLSQEDLQKEIQQAHLFVHPSRVTADGDREGIPNAMLEAMAAGVPVIATEHGGIPEAVTSGREGFLVAENDLTALIAALQTLTSDERLYPEMSRAAWDRIQREFSEDAQTANLEKIYGDLIR